MKQFKVKAARQDWERYGQRGALRRLYRFLRWRLPRFQFRNPKGWGPKRTRAEARERGTRRLKQLNVGETLAVRNRNAVTIYINRIADTEPQRTMEDWLGRGANWAVNHTLPIHYGPVRPIPISQVNVHPNYGDGEGPWPVPITTDCSGSITMLFRSAAAPDPNGLGYNGGGSSFQMTSHLESFSEARTARIGDLVTWHSGDHGHVAMFMGGGGDPLLFSHGFEGGPLFVGLAAESSVHAGETRTFLRRGF